MHGTWHEGFAPEAIKVLKARSPPEGWPSWDGGVADRAVVLGCDHVALDEAVESLVAVDDVSYEVVMLHPSMIT
jgi:hypothetical protein